MSLRLGSRPASSERAVGGALSLRLGTTSRALADLDRRQGAVLSTLQDPASDHGAMLTALLVSNTLLELSKLASARLTLSAFADAAIATVNQCAPITGCAVVFSVADLPPVRSASGAWPGADHDHTFFGQSGEPVASFGVEPLFGLDRSAPIGYFGIAGSPEPLLEAGFIVRAADQLSSMLGILIEGERLRRAAATSQTLALIGSIADGYGEEELFELVSTIGSLPGAESAQMLLEFPRFGGPLFVDSLSRATPLSSDEDLLLCSQRTGSVDRNGEMTLTVGWGPDGAPLDSKFDAIADQLWSSIGRIEQTARLLAEVETDELTGVGNRRRASRALTQASARAKRNGESFAVFMMDLDRFKSVNDEFGHDMGDEVLKSFAKAIESVIRGYDVAARWGGEEFIIVCPSTNAPGSEALARRLLEKTPEQCAQVLPEGRLQTVSIGIAVCENGGRDPMELIKRADTAMYQAKTTGRNKYVVAETA